MTKQHRVTSPTAYGERHDAGLIARRSVPPTGSGQSTGTAWVLGRPQWAALLMSYLGLVIVGTGLGLLLKGPLDDTFVLRSDRRVAEWFAAHRTPNSNTYTVWGSDLADTFRQDRRDRSRA